MGIPRSAYSPLTYTSYAIGAIFLLLGVSCPGPSFEIVDIGLHRCTFVGPLLPSTARVFMSSANMAFYTVHQFVIFCVAAFERIVTLLLHSSTCLLLEIITSFS